MRKYLLPIAFLYECVMRMRLAAYRRKIFKTNAVSVPVICVGNITVGGTGKTPIVISIVERLLKAGKKPAILSRGYKRTGGEKRIEIISSDHPMIASPDTGGDEPTLMARALPGVSIALGANRYEACLRLLDEIHPDVIVMDDGFQHLAFHRDLDILVFDALKPLKDMRMCPAGALREPLSHCRRARAAVITKTNLSKNSDQRTQEIAAIAPDLKIFKSTLEIDAVAQMGTKNARLMDFDPKRRQLAVCGIGNPEGFFQLVRQKLRAKQSLCLSYRDHYKYQLKDLQSIEEKRMQYRAQWILTTEKDAIKIGAINADPSHWLVVKTKAKIKEEDSLRFDELILGVF